MPNTVRIRRQGGAELTVGVDNGTLVATPLKPKKRYTFAELLEGSDEMIALSKHAAGWDSGAPLGNEIL